ncbi:MAG: PEGA domain-containing protein [Deltaproteobacteria bacterium]|nr:PEGA domain-containing protein [Deltaproteobacteria bacterium]MCW5809020.1 PEGA domain-containing protein [Deltaproteobacteria bacterium]
MGLRPVALLAPLLLGAGVAHAGPKQKVQIDTKPTGATVYLNAKEDGPVCKATPCGFDAPVGDTTLIVELAGHKPVIEILSVPARPKAPLKFSFALEVARGTVTLKGPAGATVRVDKVDKGKVPAIVDIDVGDPHEVEWLVDGKVIDTQAVSVEDGEDVTLEGKAKDVADADGDGDGDGEDPVKGPAIKKGTSAKERGPLVAVSLAFSVGFRDFTYEEPRSSNLDGTETERGQLLAGPVIEIWPGTLFGVRPLRGVSLYVRYGHGLNQQTVLDNKNNPTTAKTFWRSFEASVRHRWTIGTTGTFEVGAGFVRDQHQFDSMTQADIDRVPDADYQAIRIGGRGSLLLGAIEPFVTFENRFVMEGIGQIEDRFSLGASATGLRASLGAVARFGKVSALVEASLTRYSWTFQADPTKDMFEAPGGVDSIKTVGLQVGYAY